MANPMKEAAARERRIGEERALASVLPVLDRLRATLEAETFDLQQRGAVDYSAYSQRKNQSLLELNRLRPALESVATHPDARAALTDLAAKLDVNHRLLGIQLRAAQTVSSIVARAIREGQSDGTYSAHPWRDEHL